MLKNNNILKEPTIIPVGSTVVIHREDSRPWTHLSIIGQDKVNHNTWSYKLQLIGYILI